MIMEDYRWIRTAQGGLLQVKREPEHCNGRNATPYMALVGKEWKRIYWFEGAYMACYIKCNGEKIKVFLYE